MAGAYAFRAGVPADAERLAALTAEGFEGYRSFAAAGWEPPSPGAEVDGLRELLGDDDFWCLVAECDGEVAGDAAFLPAARAVHAVDDPALAHLRALFVRPAHWGTGLATDLHGAALRAARERAYTTMRLFTPAGQARAPLLRAPGLVAARPTGLRAGARLGARRIPLRARALSGAYSSRPRRIASATAAARSETPSFS